MLYHLYELGHAAMSPARMAASSTRLMMRNPLNPLSYTEMGRNAAAAAELVERTTRRYKKPAFNLRSCTVGGQSVAIAEEVVWRKPFCNLIHFRKAMPEGARHDAPRVLMVAPLSGHYATLLRGTVEAMLPHADVYITDWTDARLVPLREGGFDLDDYVDYIIEMIELFQGDVHVMGVCQPGVPVMAAVALMEARNHPFVPKSVILKGSPIDTRVSPTAVNRLAEERGTNWFRRTVVTSVPWPNEGAGRLVYPGFLQLTGFMAMNLDRHVKAHKDLFFDLVKGDGDSVEKHKEFYDEYLAVMDLAAEYYIQTIDQVFVKHTLPKGEMRHRGHLVDLSAIRRVALMTIEGEKDDITGRGQTEAAVHLCTGLPETKKQHYTQPGVGHYGIFNGSRYRTEVVPRIFSFIADHDERGDSTDARGGSLTRLWHPFAGDGEEIGATAGERAEDCEKISSTVFEAASA
ncbi:polyhydroxyalkanoate depolymerase [Rhodomicrobium lacus]|uniref:polyhydroxyalkanoate depolymerase n=1 Tax=Rhodomicrobium lacus TaxID=2498452 RepID=UPI001FE0B12F|nr:polyhydroxyalkanoate depolymerase [Rhodomicrobium lacus]